FSLALSATYNPTTRGGLDGGEADFKGAAPVIAVITFLLYLGAFLIVCKANEMYVRRRLETKDKQSQSAIGASTKSWKSDLAVISGTAVGSVLFLVGGGFLCIVTWFTGALDYFTTVLFSATGLGIAVVLVATVIYLQLAFTTVTQRAVV